MNVTLYKVSDPNNKLIKTLGTGTDVSAAAYDPQSVEQPQLLLSTANSDYNYAYISDFGKYYFIGEPILNNDGILVYPLTLDPLMTYADDILNLDAVIQRQAENFNEYINDGTFIPDTREFIQCVNFSTGFNDTGELILITAGGVATI